MYLSPYVEEPLSSKLIKSFVPELRSRKCFSCFGIPMFYVYMLRTFYVRFTHIHVWVWYSLYCSGVRDRSSSALFLCSLRVVVSIPRRCFQCWQIHFFLLFWTYHLSPSSLQWKALGIIMSFLVFWSIFWSSSLIHFKNSPEYLTKGTAKVFILWWDFCYMVWFWVVFSFSWGKRCLQ